MQASRAATPGELEPVIGLEVHAQLSTASKIFCACSTRFGAPPNSLTCPVCLGHPGALPVLNRGAVDLALRAAAALGCEIRPVSRFERKNYFYPDLPKGYQISQYAEPLAEGGHVEIEVDGAPRAVGLIRLHLEEDAGKSIHDPSGGPTRIDLNRAGTPLVEIVTLPEIAGPEEAHAFLQRLRSLLRYIEVCDGNMEQGSLRCDANVSVRPSGSATLGTRTELKNLNSFRNVQRALAYEIERQCGIVRGGGVVRQQTVLWDESAGVTRPMRGKEEAEDYRYFPDPDLPPVVPAADRVAAIRAALPELPAARKRRLAADYGLDEGAVHALTLERELADLYEEVARACGRPREAANWLLNDLARLQNERAIDHKHVAGRAPLLVELIRLVDSGRISNSVARQELFEPAMREGRSPEALMRERGLEQIRDEDSLLQQIDLVMAEYPEQVRQYRAGKRGLLGFLVGRVMRRTGGAADPRRVDELLRRRLGHPADPS